MSDEKDVVEGQDLIDDLCWRFGTADNNSPGTPTDPYGRNADEQIPDTPSHDEVGKALRDSVEYNGDDPADWDIPDDEPVEYHAVLRARERSDELPNLANWELIGYAAALAYHNGISKEQLLADLEAHPTPQYGFDEGRARKEIRGVWHKASEGNHEPPSKFTLAKNGILPKEWAYGPPAPKGLKHRESGYWKVFVNDEGEVTGEKQVTNFHLETVSRLEHDDGEREFRIRVKPVEGEPYIVCADPTTLIDTRKFKETVLVGWSTTFDGKQEDLNAIKQFVAAQDAPLRRGTEHIGLHGNEWVVPGGSLTADGWADDPENVFEAANTPLANKCALEPSMGADYDLEDVREILRLLPKTRLTERFLPAMGWFYAAATRPYIQSWEGEFNILAVTGDSGAGKTASLEMLWESFGVDGDLLRADGTTFPKMRALATSNALPIIFDEYKPADMAGYIVDGFHSLLRTSTRGGIEEKGRPDGSVVGHELLAPAVISGEQALRGTAEERRTLQTNFSRQASVGGSPESEAFTKLTGGDLGGEFVKGYDLTQHALAYYQWILDQPEPGLKHHWRTARDRTAVVIDDLGIGDLDDMRFQAIQTLVYGCRLYQSFARDMGVEDVPVGDREIERAMKYILNERTSTEHVSNLDRLLELAGRASSAGYLHRGEHFEIVAENEPDEELRIKLSLVYDQLRRYARDHDIQDADLLDSGNDYRSRISEAAEDDDSYVLATSKQTRGLNRCVAIGAASAEADIDGFEMSMFRDGDDEDDHVDEDDAVTPGFALSALDPTRGQPVTFRARVTSILEPKPWLQAEGILQDDDGVARFIARGSDNPASNVDEGDRVEIRDAMVTTNENGAPVVELIDGLTTIVSAAAPSQQSGLEEAASTDGGTQVELTNQRIDEIVRLTDEGETITVAGITGDLGGKFDPETVADRLETIATERGILENFGDGEFKRL